MRMRRTMEPRSAAGALSGKFVAARGEPPENVHSSRQHRCGDCVSCLGKGPFSVCAWLYRLCILRCGKEQERNMPQVWCTKVGSTTLRDMMM